MMKIPFQKFTTQSRLNYKDKEINEMNRTKEHTLIKPRIYLWVTKRKTNQLALVIVFVCNGVVVNENLKLSSLT